MLCLAECDLPHLRAGFCEQRRERQGRGKYGQEIELEEIDTGYRIVDEGDRARADGDRDRAGQRDGEHHRQCAGHPQDIGGEHRCGQRNEQERVRRLEEGHTDRAGGKGCNCDDLVPAAVDRLLAGHDAQAGHDCGSYDEDAQENRGKPRQDEEPIAHLPRCDGGDHGAGRCGGQCRSGEAQHPLRIVEATATPSRFAGYAIGDEALCEIGESVGNGDSHIRAECQVDSQAHWHNENHQQYPRPVAQQQQSGNEYAARGPDQRDAVRGLGEGERDCGTQAVGEREQDRSRPSDRQPVLYYPHDTPSRLANLF